MLDITNTKSGEICNQTFRVLISYHLLGHTVKTKCTRNILITLCDCGVPNKPHPMHSDFFEVRVIILMRPDILYHVITEDEQQFVFIGIRGYSSILQDTLDALRDCRKRHKRATLTAKSPRA